MVAGQNPSSVVSSGGQTSFLAGVYEVDAAETVAVDMPLSAAASALGRTAPQVSFPADAAIIKNSGYSSVALGVASLAVNPDAAVAGLSSPVLRVYLAGAGNKNGDDGSSRRLGILTLSSHRSNGRHPNSRYLVRAPPRLLSPPPSSKRRMVGSWEKRRCNRQLAHDGGAVVRIIGPAVVGDGISKSQNGDGDRSFDAKTTTGRASSWWPWTNCC
ncbi:unnamed protein product [Phaeothamnion confervicola]